MQPKQSETRATRNNLQSGDKWQFKKSVSNDLRSTFFDSIIVFHCHLCEVFIEYRPKYWIHSQNNPKQGLLKIVYIFHVPVEKKCFYAGYAAIENSWQTIDECGTEIAATIVFMPPLFVECGRALSVAHVRLSVRLSVRPCVLPFVHHLGRYFVSATPPTIFSQSFWNFTGVFVKDWRCAWHLDIVTFFTVWT